MRKEIDVALAQVAERPSALRLLYIEQSSRLSLAALQDRAGAHFAQYGSAQGGGPGLLVVDYLQRGARASMPAGVQSELRLAVAVLPDQVREPSRQLDSTGLALGPHPPSLRCHSARAPRRSQ